MVDDQCKLFTLPVAMKICRKCHEKQPDTSIVSTAPKTILHGAILSVKSVSLHVWRPIMRNTVSIVLPIRGLIGKPIPQKSGPPRQPPGRPMPIKLRPDQATYRAANREKLTARTMAFFMAHPEKRVAIEQRRRARKRSAPRNDLTAAQWRAIKEHYNHSCVYCGRKMQRLTIDHIVPLSKGGSHTLQNVVPACQSCNSRKNSGPVLKPVQPLLLI